MLLIMTQSRVQFCILFIISTMSYSLMYVEASIIMLVALSNAGDIRVTPVASHHSGSGRGSALIPHLLTPLGGSPLTSGASPMPVLHAPTGYVSLLTMDRRDEYKLADGHALVLLPGLDFISAPPHVQSYFSQNDRLFSTCMAFAETLQQHRDIFQATRVFWLTFRKQTGPLYSSYIESVRAMADHPIPGLSDFMELMYQNYKHQLEPTAIPVSILGDVQQFVFTLWQMAFRTLFELKVEELDLTLEGEFIPYKLDQDIGSAIAKARSKIKPFVESARAFYIRKEPEYRYPKGLLVALSQVTQIKADFDIARKIRQHVAAQQGAIAVNMVANSDFTVTSLLLKLLSGMMGYTKDRIIVRTHDLGFSH